MNLLNKLKPTLPFKDHISAELVREFSERMKPFMEKAGLSYIAYWHLPAKGGLYTALYTDLEVAEIFQQPSSYHLGILKMQKNTINPFSAGLTEKALTLLRSRHSIEGGRGWNIEQSDGFSIIHTASKPTCDPQIAHLHDQAEFLNYTLNEVLSNCPDLIEQVKSQPIAILDKSAAATALAKYWLKIISERFTRKSIHKQHKFAFEYNGHCCQLTKREFECLQLLLHRSSGLEISETMKVSSNRVERIIQNIKRKTQCYSRDQLIKAAIQNGLLNSHDGQKAKEILV